MGIKAHCGGLIIDNSTLKSVNDIITTASGNPTAFIQANCGVAFDKDIFEMVDGVITLIGAEEVTPLNVFCGGLIVDATYFSTSGGELSFEEPVPPARPSIVSFVIDDVEGEIVEKTVTLTMPASTDVTALTPTIVVSEGATISPASGVEQDFTDKVTYRVSTTDDYVDYEVIVEVEEADDTEGTDGE